MKCHLDLIKKLYNSSISHSETLSDFLNYIVEYQRLK